MPQELKGIIKRAHATIEKMEHTAERARQLAEKAGRYLKDSDEARRPKKTPLP